jgi:hypothetical protein
VRTTTGAAELQRLCDDCGERQHAATYAPDLDLVKGYEAVADLYWVPGKIPMAKLEAAPMRTIHTGVTLHKYAGCYSATISQRFGVNVRLRIIGPTWSENATTGANASHIYLDDKSTTDWTGLVDVEVL